MQGYQKALNEYESKMTNPFEDELSEEDYEDKQETLANREYDEFNENRIAELLEKEADNYCFGY